MNANGRFRAIFVLAHIVFIPDRYVGAEAIEDDGEPFDEKMAWLTEQWQDQQKEAKILDKAIAKNLKELGYGE